MQEAVVFVVQIALLLLVPGPTNTLLWLSGKENGIKRSAVLMAAEVAGYLIVIVPLVAFLAPVLDGHPSVLSAMKMAAALWIAYVAYKLWRPVGNEREESMTSLKVFCTTVLNPKATVLGIAVFPRHDVFANLSLFVATLLPVALMWISFGALVGHLSRPGTARIVRRAASACLFVFSAILASKALSS